MIRPRAQGDKDGAVSFLEEALALRKQVLGEKHADTIKTSHLLEDVKKN